MQLCESCAGDFLLLFSVFVRQKVTVNENIIFADSVSGMRPPECSESAKNLKNDNDVTIFRHDVNVNFFWRCFVSLVKFSYWSKFHVNIISGSRIMTTFFYKGLTRNPEVRNTPVWVLPNIWRLVQFRNTKFGANVSNRMLLNARNFQVIKGKSTGAGGVKIRPPHTDYGKYSLFLISKMYWYSGFKEDIYMFYHIHDTVS